MPSRIKVEVGKIVDNELNKRRQILHFLNVSLRNYCYFLQKAKACGKLNLHIQIPIRLTTGLNIPSGTAVSSSSSVYFQSPTGKKRNYFSGRNQPVAESEVYASPLSNPVDA